jgi:hypothetical protein
MEAWSQLPRFSDKSLAVAEDHPEGQFVRRREHARRAGRRDRQARFWTVSPATLRVALLSRFGRAESDRELVVEVVELAAHRERILPRRVFDVCGSFSGFQASDLPSWLPQAWRTVDCPRQSSTLRV